MFSGGIFELNLLFNNYVMRRNSQQSKDKDLDLSTEMIR